MNYTDVMVDLETLGTAPGSVILSIGAVAFNADTPESSWSQFYSAPILQASCTDLGLTVDDATVTWWRARVNETTDLRNFYEDTENAYRSMHLAVAITDFKRWFPTGAALWGNGANFDNVLLRGAFKACRVPAPWAYYDDACYRTMKNRFKTQVPAPRFQGLKHDALADALHQTRHLVAILRHVDAGNLLTAQVAQKEYFDAEK